MLNDDTDRRRLRRLIVRTGTVTATLCGFLAASAPAATDCTLVVDAAAGAVIAREGPGCETRTSPASTFKLALSVMGYDAGILHDAHAPAWPYKPEYRAWRESWKQTTDPVRWLAESVVWYSQELTRTLGLDRFRKYVDAFDYGNRDLSGDPGLHNGLTHAWLSSSLQISPAEEVGFVRKLLAGELPVSTRAREMTMTIVPSFPRPDGWTIYGKTGTGNPRGAGGALDESREFGWFVGWARAADRTVAFARRIEQPARKDLPAGFAARDSLLADFPRLLHGSR